jgi:hypothetical protein
MSQSNENNMVDFNKTIVPKVKGYGISSSSNLNQFTF